MKYLLLRNLFIIMGFFPITFAFSQKSISGVVSDQTSEPLIGVNIQIKNTANGIFTDSPQKKV